MKSKYVYMAIIIIPIIVILLLLLVNFSRQNKNSNANTNESVNTTLLKDGAGQKYGQYQTNGQIVFINDTYKYRLALPNDWVVDETNDPMRAAFFDSVAFKQAVATELLQGMKLEIYAESGEAGTVEQAVNQKMAAFQLEEIPEEKPVAVDGVPAIKIKMEIMGYSVATYVKKGNILYTIVGYIGDQADKEKYEAKYSSILSTFEFLD